MLTTALTEAEIMEKVVAFKSARLSPEIAREFLKFRFDSKTTADIRRLLRKNNRGTITAAERILLEKFLRVGQFLDLLHAQARVILHAAEKLS